MARPLTPLDALHRAVYGIFGTVSRFEVGSVTKRLAQDPEWLEAISRLTSEDVAKYHPCWRPSEPTLRGRFNTLKSRSEGCTVCGREAIMKSNDGKISACENHKRFTY